MKRLIVPCLRGVDAADQRLIQVAEFCGVPCEVLRVEVSFDDGIGWLDKLIDEDDVCVVVNGRVMQEWASSAESFPPAWGDYLVSRFSSLLVHNLNSGAFSASLLKCLSDSRLTGLESPPKEGAYEIGVGKGAAFGSFEGLVFGPINPTADRVFAGEPGAIACQVLVAVSGRPLFVRIDRGRAQIFLLAVAEIADLAAPEQNPRAAAYFSRLVPLVMFFRHAFPRQSWQPHVNNATLVIDDPLLTRRYGFLNYRCLLEIMDQYEFHTSIAFIPYNRFRTTRSVARMFRERPDRYSLCVHGSDHTAGEFGITNESQLNLVLHRAIQRMDEHQRATKIPYSKVMVFPQGVFSEVAMKALKSHNFLAAVNSKACPRDTAPGLQLGDHLEPALLRYGGFPLYLRRLVGDTTRHDVAFSLFFGKPVLLVEHHAAFQNIDPLLAVVAQINTFPGLRWSSLDAAIEGSFMKREPSKSVLEVRAYASGGRVGEAPAGVSYCVVSKSEDGRIPVRRILLDQTAVTRFGKDNGAINFEFDIKSTRAHAFSVQYQNQLPTAVSKGRVRDAIRVAWRRRASEFRDNYLSGRPGLLAVAEKLAARIRKAGVT